ncbi:MAG: glycerol kinase [Fusicatenibacter sp.]|nr:glycerol kinase [Fusicatenibacter sp.]
MKREYIIGIDQSTQGTKAMLFDGEGRLLLRTDLPHRQIINEKGWVSHDLNEIYRNTVQTVKTLLENSGINPSLVAAIGISNQRETTALWDRATGEPLEEAVVWQCGRASKIAEELEKKGYGERIRKKTGMPLSAYFPAAKMAWLLNHDEREASGASKESRRIRAQKGELMLGTIDSWLIYKLTENHAFCTDYSNASRTQLFCLQTLSWDEELCEIFGIPVCALPKVCDSDAFYGTTVMEGLFEEPVPICGVLGDSHAALFGQGCLAPGMIKATYGTGSSLMMNIGTKPLLSSHGVVTSLAWSRNGKAEYVLEGNLNYTGAVITWLKEDLGLIDSAKETEELAGRANPADRTYLVPAFTGLGAPYWDEKASAAISGMTRTTGKAEIVKAALDCIAYQITDLIRAMEQDTGMEIAEIRVDGGPTRNGYLMQFQSDISGKRIRIPAAEELSGIGAAYMAGISVGLYDPERLQDNIRRIEYTPKMKKSSREEKLAGWKMAVAGVLTKE